MKRLSIVLIVVLALAMPAHAQPPELVGDESGSSHEAFRTINATVHYVAGNATGTVTLALECDADAHGDPATVYAVSTGITCWAWNYGGTVEASQSAPGPAVSAAGAGTIAFTVPGICARVVVHWSDNKVSQPLFCW